MAKTTPPIITYTEILCRAHRQLSEEIADLKGNLSYVPADMQDIATHIENEIVFLSRKQDCIKTIYKIETGTEYN